MVFTGTIMKAPVKDKLGAAMEIATPAGTGCSEIDSPPRWGIVRNRSDPMINGDLPEKEFRLNVRTTWAVDFHIAYGLYPSVCGALAAWAIVAGVQ